MGKQEQQHVIKKEKPIQGRVSSVIVSKHIFMLELPIEISDHMNIKWDTNLNYKVVGKQLIFSMA